MTGLSDVREVAAAAGVGLIGAPGEVVALEDCQTFLAEAARRDLIVMAFRLSEVLERGGVAARLDCEAFERLLPARELLGWGLLGGRRAAADHGDPRLGVEFALATQGEVDAILADANGTAPPKRRPINWGAAPELMLVATAVGLTALLVWSVTTALTCGAG
jgi:hypothetical protein